jgi:hypothetical protein
MYWQILVSARRPCIFSVLRYPGRASGWRRPSTLPPRWYGWPGRCLGHALRMPLAVSTGGLAGGRARPDLWDGELSRAEWRIRTGSSFAA